ncbi:hypothetical protein ECG_05051 [Echinococcus granulosus]|uniref:Rhodopsin orphan GPCR n=1 Tax=Echinococcus granulosus TaxID=6210 RepID=U6JJI6_ECHGR|nr:rhodopsin-like orphan GPCR [Echinococcus granulosus]EUB58808.1 rhodopsin-like orphan GPCR [Echinococcus granulosus]KAH9283691.1 hypothetical protein ECG_05051 [Echinococcus granulosus]CDS24235.1 rhodopsin orphan GPCR [Echinococcus granulosus]
MNVTNNTLSSELLPPRPYAYLYEELRIYFLRWYLPAAIIVGCMGNLFSLFFLFCSKLFQFNMLLWLSSICIGDFFILMLEGLWILLKAWFKYDIRDHNDLICKIHKAASNYSLYWSAYMQFALSVQRAYLVFKPLHARIRGGISKRHLVAWIMISLVLLAPIAPYIIYWRVIDGDCDPTDTDIYYLTTLCDLIIWGIIPLLGMTVSTAVICLNMAKLGNKFKRAQVATPERSRKFSVCTTLEIPSICRRRGLSTPTLTPVRPNSTSDIQILSSRIMDHLQQADMVESQIEFPPSQLKQRLSEHSSSRHNAPDNFGHVTRLLICMNITYMASTFPLLIFLMLRNFSGVQVDPDFHRFCYYLFRSLCFLNSCTNWIFYCLVGKLFREEAKHILRMCCGLQRKASSRGPSNQSGKALVTPLPRARTPEMSHQASPIERIRSISAIDIQRVATRVPTR